MNATEKMDSLKSRIEMMSTTLSLGEVPKKYMAQFKSHRESLIQEWEELQSGLEEE